MAHISSGLLYCFSRCPSQVLHLPDDWNFRYLPSEEFVAGDGDQVYLIGRDR